MSKPTHLAIYCDSYRSSLAADEAHPFFIHSFDIRAGVPSKFAQSISKHAALVSKVRLYPHHSTQLQAAMRLTKATRVGSIDYNISRESGKVIATSKIFEPKEVFVTQNAYGLAERKLRNIRRLLKGKRPFSDDFVSQGPRRARGLGYLIELHCLLHLQKLGVTHVKTSDRPSPSRRAQVLKAANKVNEEVPIGEWISNLRKAVGERIKQHKR